MLLVPAAGVPGARSCLGNPPSALLLARRTHRAAGTACCSGAPSPWMACPASPRWPCPPARSSSTCLSAPCPERTGTIVTLRRSTLMVRGSTLCKCWLRRQRAGLLLLLPSALGPPAAAPCVGRPLPAGLKGALIVEDPAAPALPTDSVVELTDWCARSLGGSQPCWLVRSRCRLLPSPHDVPPTCCHPLPLQIYPGIT